MLTSQVLRAEDGAPALVGSDGQVQSYGQVRAFVSAAAAQLSAQGVGPGHVVGIALSEPRAMVLAALAVWARGAAVLLLDGRAGRSYLADLGQRARVSCWVEGTDTDSLSLEPAAGASSVPADAGLVLFTSGSSGKPKGVLLGAAGILANVDAILDYLPVRECPRTAVVLPLWYSYALVGQVLVTLRAGGAVLLLGDLPFPPLQLEVMAGLGASGLSAVPLSLRLLARAALESPGAPRPVLRYVASAGAPLDATSREAVKAAFPQAELFNQYGLTEASPRVSAVSDRDPKFARGTVGRALRGIEVFAVGPEGERLEPDVEGELCLRGPSVMLGYLDDAQATARVLLADGSLRTGDLGTVDAEGYLYVRGRSDGVVKCAGERVSLAEVAEVLRRAAAVEVVVVAIPDPTLGSRLVAFVEGSDGPVGAARIAARELPPAKRPARLVSLAQLPRTANGKVDLAALRARAEAP